MNHSTFLFAKQNTEEPRELRVGHLGRANENIHFEVSVHIQPRQKEQSGSLNISALRQLSGLARPFSPYNAGDIKMHFPDMASFF